ncbi:hypothetical protein K439DRAFT_1612834 [Ramaria rubella]|nr:hypothetical protein K439DRAFT_1612834 [Ramaria rubella]
MTSTCTWRHILKYNAALFDVVAFDQVVSFIDLACHLRERITWNQPEVVTDAPAGLPISVHSFICDALGLDDQVTLLLWITLKNIIWDDHLDTDPGLLQHSLALLPLFSYYEFSSPHCRGIDPGCQHYVMDPKHTHACDLVEPVTYATTVLTKELGAIPSYNTSFYCHNCHTRYHHNYCIHSEATLCMYYPGVPWFVQASQKFFIEASMCEVFTTMMNCSW